MWSFLESLSCHSSALLSIDLQYMSTTRDMGIVSQLSDQAYQNFHQQLTKCVLPHVEQVHSCCRHYNIEMIHVRIQSLTQDGRDRSLSHKRLQLHAAPGSYAAQFLPQASPLAGEIILNKTASGVFSATNLSYLLKNLAIQTLIVIGAYSNECVSNAVRVACDEGYQVIVIEDACIAIRSEIHQRSMYDLHQRYAQVVTTADFLQAMACTES